MDSWFSADRFYSMTIKMRRRWYTTSFHSGRFNRNTTIAATSSIRVCLTICWKTMKSSDSLSSMVKVLCLLLCRVMFVPSSKKSQSSFQKSMAEVVSLQTDLQGSEMKRDSIMWRKLLNLQLRTSSATMTYQKSRVSLWQVAQTSRQSLVRVMHLIRGCRLS